MLRHLRRARGGFGAGAGRAALRTWIFAWNGTRLRSLIGDPGGDSTDSDDDPAGGLAIDTYADLDGDGKLELLALHAVRTGADDDDEGDDDHKRRTTLEYEALRLKDGLYVPWRDLASYEYVTLPTASAPAITKADFHVEHERGAYLLRLVIADSHARWRIKSAEIRLNGALVAGPPAFQVQDTVVTVPVSLQEDNTLSVKVLSVTRSSVPGNAPEEFPLITIALK